MTTNYSNGRYVVLTSEGSTLGVIDGDEYVRNGGRLLYRLDGDEIYSLAGEHLGFIEDGIAKGPSGNVIFRVRPE